MDFVNHWNQLFHIYKRCSRIGMLRRNGHAKWYWLGISLYAAISLLVFLGTYGDTYNIVITIVVEFMTAFIVGYVLSWKNGREVRDCSSFPVSERELYARYRMFKEDFKSNKTLSNLPIDDLLAWNDARFKKLDVSSVFHNPIFILVLSGVVSLVASTELVKGNSGFILVLFVFFLGGIVPLLWLLQDYLYSEKKQYFNICKFLKWIELDSKVVEGNSDQNSGPRLSICDVSKIRPFYRRKRLCGYCLR
ncbi:hypothetical protein [Aeromonas salmonicida]|uniref:hypothetical protein n=1 Tax=Aeromonas salmonicida TaxID=645 RepID=UPI00283AA1C9|nr:hypothetical protein [Aeromonas salmonicida]